MRTILTCSAVLLLAAVSASAVVIYAPNGLPRPYPFSGPDELIRFDSSDPNGYVTIGSMNVPDIGFGGMDFDRNGNLWAYASFYKSTGGAAAGLYSVDLESGQATPQGTLSNQPLDDIAFNPADNTMYGVRSQGHENRLYSIDLTTGFVSLVGLFTGGPDTPRAIGLAIDSQGAFYVHDQAADKIYWGTGLALTELYALPQDTGFSQGMTIDWSRGDMGYHAAVGYGVFPEYFCQLNTFTTDGSSYVVGPSFGPNEHFSGDQFGYPPVEPGDLAIMPALCGDVDGSGSVDIGDLGLLLSQFGLTGSGLAADINGDMIVDIGDLGILLSSFGNVCP